MQQSSENNFISGIPREAGTRPVPFQKIGEEINIEELRRKQRPCVIALEVFSQQREYMRSLQESMLPIDKTMLPCFQREYINQTCNGYPSLTWAKVAERINNGPGFEIFFLNGKPGIAASFDVYEEFYQKRILAEGFVDIIGIVTAVDGLAPLVDYLHARHFGSLRPPPRLSITIPRFDKERQSIFSSSGGKNLYDVATTLTTNTTTTAATHVGRRENIGELPQPLRNRRRILFGNDAYTSIKYRQDKSGMQRALKEHGLAYIRGISGYDLFAIKQWKREQGIPFPVIVKPVSGAGSEFVTLCHNEEEIDAAFAVCQKVKTTQLTDASHMLLQEYIEGQEYVVNVVSYKGKHVVSDVWKSWKFPFNVYSTRLFPTYEEKLRRAYYEQHRGKLPTRYHTTSLLYDRLEFVHNLAELPENSEERRVVAYTLQCIDVLGMRQGCSHCEVRIDERPQSNNKGMPVLIELNARMLGDTPRATPFVGYNQYTLIVYLAFCAASFSEEELISNNNNNNSINSNTSNNNNENVGKDNDFNEENTRSMLPWPPAPLLYRSLTTEISRHVVFLRAKEESFVCIPGVRAVKSLKTFKHLARDIIFDEPTKPGIFYTVHKTTDLLTSPGACVMEGVEEDIRRDTAFIRHIESKDLTELMLLIDAALVLIPPFISETLGGVDTFNTNPYVEVQVQGGGKAGELETGSDTFRESLERSVPKLREALGKIEAYFARPDPPLFIPLVFMEKLKSLGLPYLVCGFKNSSSTSFNMSSKTASVGS